MSHCDYCDCCLKGWDKCNKYGMCDCWCSKCGKLLKECKYKCYYYTKRPIPN